MQYPRGTWVLRHGMRAGVVTLLSGLCVAVAQAESAKRIATRTGLIGEYAILEAEGVDAQNLAERYPARLRRVPEGGPIHLNNVSIQTPVLLGALARVPLRDARVYMPSALSAQPETVIAEANTDHTTPKADTTDAAKTCDDSVLTSPLPLSTALSISPPKSAAHTASNLADAARDAKSRATTPDHGAPCPVSSPPSAESRKSESADTQR